MWLLILIEYLYLNGINFGVAPRTNTKKYISLKEIGLRAQNMITIISNYSHWKLITSRTVIYT